MISTSMLLYFFYLDKDRTICVTCHDESYYYQTQQLVTMEPVVPQSAFSKIPNVPSPSLKIQTEAFLKQLLRQKRPLNLTQVLPQLKHLPPPLRLLFAVHQTVCVASNSLNIGPVPHPETVSSSMTPNLLKSMLTLIEKRFFDAGEEQLLLSETSYCLLFKEVLSSHLTCIWSEDSNCVRVDKIINFYQALISEQYVHYLPLQLYYLLGGGVFTVEAKTFKERLTALIQQLGVALSASDSVTTRHMETLKLNKSRRGVLDESLKVVILSKNKNSIEDLTNSITASVFRGCEYLKQDEFIFTLHRQPVSPTLSLLLEMVRGELLLLQQPSFQVTLSSRNQSNKTNFYAHEMSKLFKKCPFNGDERCDCKKCQCVRRNRESAKLSQEKKRNAVEEVEGLRKRMVELEGKDRVQASRIQQLEEENMLLKRLLKDMAKDPKSLLRVQETMEPISKVINNQLE